MPFAPAVSPNADKYIYSGLTSAGSTLSDSLLKTIQQIEDDRKKLSFSDSVIQHMMQSRGPDGKPYVTPEMLADYQKGSMSQKQGIVHGALANANFDIEQMKASTEANLGKAHADYFRAAAAGKLDGGGDNPVQIDPVTDPASSKVIPGMGIVRKTGAIVNTSPDEGPPELDASGKFYKDRKSNSWKPLPAATMVLPGMGQVQPGGQQPAAAPTNPAEAGQRPGQVHMIGPDGKGGWVPAGRLQDYIAAGYRQG